ncbi:MAG: hypothetical protein M1830_000377, partial [Pleopsidium flavum]
MPAKKKHEITHPPTSPTLTPSPTSDTFEASTCSELCTRHKHPPGGLLQATSCKASTLNPLATSCSKSSAQVSSLSSTTFQAPATSQDPQTLVLKTAETTKLVHPFRNTVEVITPLSSSNLVTSSTSSLNKT